MPLTGKIPSSLFSSLISSNHEAIDSEENHAAKLQVWVRAA